MFFSKGNSSNVPDHSNQRAGKDLMQQIAGGNDIAFAQLFNVYRQQVYSYALHFTRTPEYAEEIVQDVFLKIWLHRERMAELENFEGYLHVMVRNFSFNMLKKIANEEALKNGWGRTRDTAENTVSYKIIEKDHQLILQHALEQLSPQQRLVYVLRSDFYLKNDEIASRLNISPATVKVHLKKGLRAIRAFVNARKGITWLILLGAQNFF
jgi:RNA polymerase sigma-70 factor (ECF subfamily)